MAVVVAIHGPSGSGKTTLIGQVIPRLKRRGLSVGVIKHAHDGFVLDRRGKDSWRMWQAGAAAVLVAGPAETMLRHRVTHAALPRLLAQMPKDLDCILVEGFAPPAGENARFIHMRFLVESGGIRYNGRWIPRDDPARIEALLLARLPRKGATRQEDRRR